MIESVQGVRQGDPLSALLFCIYMRDVLLQVNEKTGVKVYGFFDDINLVPVVGKPQQLMAALSQLQQSLPAVSLQLNTAKCHFTYFHDHLTPLTAAVCSTLSTNNIQLHHDWVGVVGAVVGRDDAAIRTGIRSVLSAAHVHDAFFRRVQLDATGLHETLQLLRVSMVPAVQYHLRCIAPVCIEDEARCFDQRMMEAVMEKLGLDDRERDEHTTTRLQRKLRDGGCAFTPALRTSPADFLGSLAACHDEPVFTKYCGSTPVPDTSLLHGWVDDSLQRVRQAAPGDEYQSDMESLLPATASTFFSFYSAAVPSTTTQLQRALSAKANTHIVQAAVTRMKEQARRGDKFEWAHHKAITAKGAWGWKVVRPEGPHLRLSDVEYVLAARLNLALPPFPARAMALLPEHCPLCAHLSPTSLRDDPWHWLACRSMTNGELSRRHDAVMDAIARVAWQVGAQVKKEVRGLDPNSQQRPDLQIAFPGRMLLTDVAVSHSLTPNYIAQSRSSAAVQQRRRDAKYAGVASRLGAELLNVAVDTCGGMATDASRLVQAIGEDGERWSMGTWSSASIERQLLGAIARRGRAAR